MASIKEVVITACEWKIWVDKYFPKSFKTLKDAEKELNWNSFIDWKVRFKIFTSSWDEYEGKINTNDYKDYVDLIEHIRSHLNSVINSNLSFIKDKDKKNAKEWLDIISNS